LGSVTVDVNNPKVLREVGLAALRERLGVVGAMNFMRQFEVGYGDFTKERHQLFEGMTIEDIYAEIKANRDKTAP